MMCVQHAVHFQSSPINKHPLTPTGSQLVAIGFAVIQSFSHTVTQWAHSFTVVDLSLEWRLFQITLFDPDRITECKILAGQLLDSSRSCQHAASPIAFDIWQASYAYGLHIFSNNEHCILFCNVCHVDDLIKTRSWTCTYFSTLPWPGLVKTL